MLYEITVRTTGRSNDVMVNYLPITFIQSTNNWLLSLRANAEEADHQYKDDDIAWVSCPERQQHHNYDHHDKRHYDDCDHR